MTGGIVRILSFPAGYPWFWSSSAAFLAGVGGAWAVARWGAGLGLVALPTSRGSHTHPTPTGGGIGLVLALAGLMLWRGIPLFVWLPGVLLALVSLLGDRHHLTPAFRLAMQCGAAAATLHGLGIEGLLGAAFPPESRYGVLHYALLLLYMVASANFYNFMDGINGLAGSSGALAFGLLALYAAFHGKALFFVELSAVMAGGCLGFLPFNVPRARVFMGDVGSILLGFMFATVVVGIAATIGEFFLLVGFLFPLYTDVLITLGERLGIRQPLLQPHRCHLYQILVNERGVPHWQVTAGYGVLQVVIAGMLWGLAGRVRNSVPVALFFLFFCFWWVSRRVKARTADVWVST